MKELQTMLGNKELYMESAGRADKAGVVEAIREHGADTVVRLCIWRHS